MALVLTISVDGAVHAGSLPQGPQVVTGTVTVQSPNSSTLNITQTTNRAAIDWQSFSIGQGNTVNIQQPNAHSVQLDQVVGNDVSQIFGDLNSNGRVILANPNGVWFGPNSRVNVSGIVATTSTASAADMAAFGAGGRLSLSQQGKANASVTNQGTITVSQAGLAAFVAPTVANNGTITAKLGTVQLSSGTAPTLDFYGDGLISLAVTGQAAPSSTAPAVSNTGTISASGGVVELSANAAAGVVNQVINNSGVIEAKSVGQQNGQIVLNGGTSGTVTVSGTLDASGLGKGQTGGTVKVLGNNVELANGATVNVSGNAGGGNAMIGGDFHGTGPDMNAATTTVAKGATIEADAVASGTGGNVAVWSNDATSFDGTISAMGGLRGKGGLVETSGHYLDVGNDATVDTLAQDGTAGTWLLDPDNVTIQATGSETCNTTCAPTGSNSTLSVATLEAALASNNVTVSTGTSGGQDGDITVASQISWSSAHTLTLSASTSSGSIFVDAPIIVGYSGSNPSNAGLLLNYSTSNGSLSFATGGYVNFASTGNTLKINGNSYTLLNSMTGSTGLTSMNGNSGRYALANSIDASGSGTFSDSVVVSFAGTFEGLGNTVSNVSINNTSPTHDETGLFGTLTGTVRDVGLIGGTVQGSNSVGALVGLNNGGNVTQSYATTNVIGSGDGVGGLVGQNTLNGGKVSLSYATGTVTDTGSSASNGVGGLVGLNEGSSSSVSNSYATGAVIGGNATQIGGLIGFNSGAVSDVYATGFVSGGSSVGGLIGSYSSPSSSFSSGYYDTGTSGTTNSARGSGESTATLQGSLPSGFISSVWGTGSGLYPYLKWQYPATPQALSGTAYSDLGMTAYASTSAGAKYVTGLVGGTSLGAVSTGANGYYYLLAPAGTIASGGSAVLAYEGTASATGARLQTLSGTTSGFNIWGDTLIAPTTATSLSTAPQTGTALATADTTLLNTALGSNAAPTNLNSLTNAGYIATGSGFTIDQAVTDGLFVTTTAAGASIIVADSILWSTGAAVELDANDSVYIEAPVTHSGLSQGALTITTNASGDTSLEAGRLYVLGSQVAPDLGGVVTLRGSDILTIDGNVYTLITTNTQFGNMSTGSGHYYALDADLTNPNDFAGDTFSGTFEGLGHTISSLSITNSSQDDVGLFGTLGSSGVINNLGLVNPTISTSSSNDNADIGALVGVNNGNIYNSWVASSGGGTASVVNKGDASGAEHGTGGLVGVNNGTILTSFVDGVSVTGQGTGQSTSHSYDVGGFVGQNGSDGTIAGSLANNPTLSFTDTSASNHVNAGGFVGANDGTVQADIYVGPNVTANHVSAGNFAGAGPCHTGCSVPLSITASKTYDGTTAASPTASGLETGDNLFALYATFSSASAGSAPLNLYDSLLVNYGGHSGNYYYTLSNTTGTINPAALTLTLDGTRAYDGLDDASWSILNLDGTILPGDDVSLAHSGSGTLVSSDVSLVGGVPQPIAFSSLGTLSLTGAQAGNYTLTLAGSFVTITPAGVVVTALGGSSTYGQTPTNPGLSASGLVNGEGIGVLTGLSNSFGITATTGVGGSPYTLTVAGTLSNPNYTVTSTVNGQWVVDPAQLTVTAADKSMQYGASSLPTLTDTITGFVNGENDSVVSGSASLTTTATAYNGTAHSGSDVGNYAIVAGQGSLAASNYTFTFVNGSLSVTPAALTVTANPQSKNYGTNDPALTYQLAGLANGDSSTDAVSGNLVRSGFGTLSGEQVGSYAITQGSLTVPTNSNGLQNYTITYNPALLTINPAALAVMADAEQKIYGTDDPTLTYEVSGLVNATVDGVVISDQASNVLSGTLTRDEYGSLAGEQVGSYAIHAGSLALTSGGQGTGSNYSFDPVGGFTGNTLTINPAQLTVTADSGQSKIYGTSDPAFTYTALGFVDTTVDGVAISDSAADVLTGALARDPGVNVGSYAINQGTLSVVPNANNLANYTISYTGATFSIDPAALVIKANDVSSTYGQTPSLTYSETGLVDGDTIDSVTLASAGTAARSNVGSYTITASDATGTSGSPGGSLSSNYIISYQTGTLSIGKATLTITAEDVVKTYGQTATLTYDETGLVNGDTISMVSLSSSGASSTANVSGSPYTITASNASGSSGPTGNRKSLGTNYNIDYETGSLTINPATLIVTPDAVSTTYNGAALNNTSYSDNTANYTITGFANHQNAGSAGIDLSGSMAFNNSTGTVVEDVGTYSQSQGTLAMTSSHGNYVMDFVNPTPNNYVITPKSLTITANNGSKTYDTTAFSGGFGVSFNGFVGGQNSSVLGGSLVYGGTAQGAVDAGNYSIVPSGYTSSNYAITFRSGTLTINPAALTVTGTRLYDDDNDASFSILTLNGLLGADQNTVTLASGSGNLASSDVRLSGGTPQQVALSNIGSLKLTGTDSQDYKIVTSGSGVIIDPLPVVLSGTRQYDGTNGANGSILTIANAYHDDDVRVTGSGTLAGSDASTTPYGFTSTGSLALAGRQANDYTLQSVTIGTTTYSGVTGNASAVTITPAVLNITGDKTYDGTTVFLNGTIDDLVVNSPVAGQTITLVGSVDAPSPNASTYNGVALNSGGNSLGILVNGGTAGTGNYQLPNTASLKIDPAVLTLSGSKTYDGNGTFGTGDLTVSGAVDNETITLASGTSVSTFCLFCTPPSNAGSYTGYTGIPSFTVAAGASSANKNPVVGNYVFDTVNILGFPLPVIAVPLTINPAALSIAIVGDPTKFYDGTDAASLTSANYSLTGFVAGQGATVNQTSGSYTTANASDPDLVTASLSAGDFTAKAGTSLSNYILPTTASGNGTINPAQVTLSAVTDTKYYDGNANSAGAPTYQVTTFNADLGQSQLAANTLYGSDTLTGLGQSFNSPNANGTNGSTLSVNPGYVLSSNYTVTTTNTALGTINPAQVTLSAVADTKSYDGTTDSSGKPVYQVTTFNADLGETELSANTLYSTDSVTGLSQSFNSPNVSGATTVSVNGGYVFSPSGNYTVTTVNTAVGTINPAALTITANDQSKTYDGKAFDFTGTEFTTSGLQNGETIASVTLTTSPDNPAINKGSYAITPSDPVAGAGSNGTTFLASNYDITFNPGTLTINPAALTITANDQSKTYGDTFTFQGTEFTTAGLVTGDSVSSATITSAGAAGTATVVSPGPTYAIDIADAVGVGLSNYTITYVGGTMTVNPKTLAISADDVFKLFGTTYTFTGTEFTTSPLVNGDTVTSATLTSAGAVANAITGDFPIDISNAVGSGLGNYFIVYVPGTMTVQTAQQFACEPNCTVPQPADNGTPPIANPNFSFLPNGINPAAGDPGSINPQAGALYCADPKSQQCLAWLAELQIFLSGNQFLGGQPQAFNQ